MNCDRCQALLEPGEERPHLGQTLCEDCYMDILTPVRTCDPWAVHSAKSLEKHGTGALHLTPRQEEILAILKGSGPLEPTALVERLSGHASIKELEREFASLRHMEKARGEKINGRVFLKLW